MLGDKGLMSILYTGNSEGHHENFVISGTWQCHDTWAPGLSASQDLFLEISCFVVTFRNNA